MYVMHSQMVLSLFYGCGATNCCTLIGWTNIPVSPKSAAAVTLEAASVGW